MNARLFVGSSLVLGTLFSCNAAGKFPDEGKEYESDATYARLIQRLEAGMSALEELGEESELA